MIEPGVIPIGVQIGDRIGAGQIIVKIIAVNQRRLCEPMYAAAYCYESEMGDQPLVPVLFDDAPLTLNAPVGIHSMDSHKN
jgi:hypothetical protein